MLFEKGRTKTGGRLSGVRNKISKALLQALALDFDKHGAEAIKIARREKPTEYLKIYSFDLAEEFEITDSRLQEIDDEELNAIIDRLREGRRGFANAGSGEGKTTH